MSRRKNPNGLASVWDLPGKLDALKRLAADGSSGTEIAAQLGLTRNQVIGKCSRLGIRLKGVGGTVRSDGVRYQRRQPVAPKVKRAHVRPPKPGPQPKPAMIFGVDFRANPDADAMRAERQAEGQGVIDSFAAGVTDDAIPLIQRGRFQCSWPVGTPDRPADQMCCGRRVSEGGSKATETYCAAHARTAIRHRQPDPRSLNKLVGWLDRIARAA